MSCSIALREKAIRYLCGGLFYCVGLERVGGCSCPANRNQLTIQDIQVGHIKKDDLRGPKLYHKILKMKNPNAKYIPLCALCNQRMVSLCKELFKYSEKFRIKVAAFASEFSRPVAAKKFKVDMESISRWQREFNIVPYKASPKYSLEFRKEIAYFSGNNTLLETAEHFNIPIWIISYARKEFSIKGLNRWSRKHKTFHDKVKS